MVKAETDEDLLGSVGPNTSVAMTPDIPDIPNVLPSKGGLTSAMHQPQPISKPIPAPLPTPSPIPAPNLPFAVGAVAPTPIPIPIPSPNLPFAVGAVAPTPIPIPIPSPIPAPNLPFAVGAVAPTPIPSPIPASNLPFAVGAVAPTPIPTSPPTVQAAAPELPVEEKKPQQVVEQVTEKQAPLVQMDGRIWPWPPKDAWNASQVYKEVVSALEQVKSGNLKEAAETLDNLGPHLSENLDMLLHIGIIMTYLGRTEHLQWTLAMAQRIYPGNEHVSSALTRL